MVNKFSRNSAFSPKRISYKLWFVISVQFLGAILGIVKFNEIFSILSELSLLNIFFAFLFFLLCVIGILGSILLYQRNDYGVLFTKINFWMQIPYIELHKFLFEYYTLARFKIFIGSKDYGFDFLTGTVFRMGVNNDIGYWAIGINLFPFLMLYLLLRVQEQQLTSKKDVASST